MTKQKKTQKIKLSWTPMQNEEYTPDRIDIGPLSYANENWEVLEASNDTKSLLFKSFKGGDILFRNKITGEYIRYYGSQYSNKANYEYFLQDPHNHDKTNPYISFVGEFPTRVVLEKNKGNVESIWPITNWSGKDVEMVNMPPIITHPASVIINNTDKNTVTSYPATHIFDPMFPEIGILGMYDLEVSEEDIPFIKKSMKEVTLNNPRWNLKVFKKKNNKKPKKNINKKSQSKKETLVHSVDCCGNCGEVSLPDYLVGPALSIDKRLKKGSCSSAGYKIPNGEEGIRIPFLGKTKVTKFKNKNKTDCKKCPKGGKDKDMKPNSLY